MANQIIMQITSENGEIKGESEVAKHQEWIDVLSWSWGMSQSASTHIGGGGTAGRVDVNDLSVVKYVDAASADLMALCASGAHLPEVKIIFQKTIGGDGKTVMDYLTITLTDVIVSSVSTGGGAMEERFVENVSFNFAQHHVLYKAQNEKGKEKSQHETAFNIKKGIAA